MFYQFLGTENPLKMMKNAFISYQKFFFGHVEKTAILERSG